jgi:hypothetical protein
MLVMIPVRLYAVKIKDMERLFGSDSKIARNVAGLILKQVAATGGDRLPLL